MATATNYIDLSDCDILSAPGDTLSELIEERRMDQKELAARTGFSKKHVNEVIAGRAALTSDFALALEGVLRLPARMWMRLEANYRAGLAQRAQAEVSDEDACWVRTFPYAQMAKLGWVEPVIRRGKEGLRLKRNQLTSFFNIASPKQWTTIWENPTVAFRRSLRGLKAPEATSAWLRAGEIAAERLNCGPFDGMAFKAAVADLKAYATREDINDALESLQTQLAGVGVALIVLPALRGTGISGATHWLHRDLAVLQVSLRYKDDGNLWFTLSHEIAHILLHGKRDVFLKGTNGQNEEKEEEANAWAANYWVPTKTREAFVRRGNYSERSVRSLADRLGVPAGVVVGQLQHLGVVSFSELNGLKRRIDVANVQS